jgi:Tol biopolymer transport system component
MSLAPGTKFGPYEIVGPLGAGGMGEVFRARDTRLGRDVALKILPAGFANDPDRRARFEREAQAVAALSHPNIVAIHDTGTVPAGPDGGSPAMYVVMELLAGQTLRERLVSGAIPVRKAVEIAVQIARGLGAAHGKGLVHRDLKPDNVFLLDDGQVKILDFGLARQSVAADHSGATQTVAATDPGVVLGTMGYMAPEQVRGKTVDARADVFAFGVVLYEMVGGKRAFHHETAADTMSAILHQEPPDLAGSRPDLSPALDRIIRHCLEKNPNERFQSTRDIAFALEALSGSTVSHPSGVGATAAVPERAPRRAMSSILVAALVVAAAGGGALLSRALSADAPASLQFTMKTYEAQSIFNARFMPDHETIIFSAAPTGNRPSLYEIRPGTLEARRFGPPDTHLLSVSSKGELAVLTNAVYLNHRLFAGTLAQMALDGAPRPKAQNVREADWNPDGSALAVVSVVDRRDQLEYPAGKRIYGADGYLSDPRVSPDGTRVAFFEHPSRFDDRGFVKVVDTAGKVTTLAGEFWGMEGLAWTPGGASVYFAASDRGAGDRPAGAMSYQVYEVRADGTQPAAFALTSPGDFTIHDIAPDGRWLATREEIRFGMIARGAGQSEERDVTWLNKCWGPFLSPAGDAVMFSDGNGGANYTVTWRKTDGSPVTKLGEGDTGGWSPDGKWALGFITSRNEGVLYPIGTGEPRKLDTAPVTRVESYGWLDSASLFITGSEPGKPRRPYVLPIAGGPAVPVLTENVTWGFAAPDFKHILGVDKEGSWAIYPLDGGASKPVPSVGDDDPFAFSPDGRTIFVMKPGSIPAKVDRIDVATGQRTAFREFGPPDRTGLIRIYFNHSLFKADGSQYVYGYVKRPSTLFLVTPQATK